MVAFCVAVCRTYSKGERDLGNASGTVEGMISIFVRPIWARSCFRRGDADANITRFPRRALSTGKSRGSGARSRGFPGVERLGLGADGCAAASYDGGGS